MRRVPAWLAALALVLAGCETTKVCVVDPGAVDPGPADVPADATPADAPGDAATDGREPADASPSDLPDGPRDTVVPDEYVPAGSFRFRMAGRDGDAFRIEVVARDLPAVFGIALRVEWDASRADLAGAEAVEVFGSEAEGAALYRAAEVRPGSLALGLALRYYLWEQDLPGDVVVATFRLRPRDAAPLGLSFYAPRCLVLDNGLGRVEATWLSATLHP